MNAPDRLNRIVLCIIGAFLVGIATYGLLRSYGVFSDASAHEPLLLDDVRRWVGRNDEWFWPAVAAVTLVIAYLSLRWLLAELRPAASVRRLQVPEPSSDDDIMVTTSGLTRAIAEDLGREPGVQDARVALLDDGDPVELLVDVDYSEDTDVGTLRHALRVRTLPHLRETLERPDVHSHVRVRTVTPRPRHVE
jgi:hypothetical protein